jgi:formate dehydrogenase maturation protein FdhE
MVGGTVKALNQTGAKQSPLCLRKYHSVGRPPLSQNPYLDSKKLLQEMVERYEEMFAQYHAIRKVFSEEAKTDASLLAKYAQVLLATNFQGDVHSKFLPLYAAIADLSEETDIPALLSRIPVIPKVQ